MLRKELKKIYMAVLFIVLIVFIIPVSVNAVENPSFHANERFDIWVAGVKLSEDNLIVNAEDNPAIQGEARLSMFEIEGNTYYELILDNFNNAGLSSTYDNKTAAIYSRLSNLRITVKQNTTLTGAPNTEKNDYGSYAIYSEGDIIIGGGKNTTLNLVSGESELWSCALNCDKSIKIEGLTLNLTTSSAKWTNGIYTSGYNITVDGAVVTANSLPSEVSYAIEIGSEEYYEENKLIIKNGASVELAGYNSAAVNPIDLSQYGKGYKMSASENIDGSCPQEYNAENIRLYKYLKIEPEKFYNIWVAGIQMSNANMTIDKVDNPMIKGSASLSVDESGKNPVYNLYLDHFDNASLSYNMTSISMGIYSKNTDLNIFVSGKNTVTSADTNISDSFAIFSEGNISIIGSKDAALNLTSGKGDVWSCALDSNKNIMIKNLTLNLSTAIDKWTNAIYTSRGDIIIDGATVVANSAESTIDEMLSNGILSGGYKSIILKNGSFVTITGYQFATDLPLDFSEYGKDYVVLASKNISGENLTEYVAENATSYKYLIIIPKNQIIEGVNGNWTKGTKSDYILKVDSPLKYFSGIKVDGVVIDSSNYEEKTEDNVVILKAHYLENLSEGTHVVSLVYSDFMEDLSTNLTVKGLINDTPKPGSDSNQDKDNRSDIKQDEEDTVDDIVTPPTKDDTGDTLITPPRTGDNASILWLFSLVAISGVGILYIEKKYKGIKEKNEAK